MLDKLALFTIRNATPEDVPVLFELIKGLAEYEKLSHAVTGDAATLSEHLFGSQPYASAIIAEVEGQAVGYALFFYNYSTFLTQPGIYLEDLFVLPHYRGQGIGKSLISYVVQIAREQGCGRVEWTVLDWNEPAISFYRSLGAEVLPEWRICRLSGSTLLP
ncbi:MAG TPA: GNAT family N-acetyltransferase [Oscillatoriaceae cyanobacterium M33_DOE_052]|uniref:GNAT family N-acetyltransferase n=1 Tax=Planktothricoides sp. SpSt-374 TaxID=2282167 RepID=A0A7C3ZMQ2_9CYAN|nr:GNAT family N-acetyltransferase [Oscillatoriaceae cyanobacterium M33_DOE_052]